MAVDGLCRTAPSLCTIRREAVDTKDGLGSYKAATWKNAIYILCMMGNGYLVHTPRHNKVYMS